MNQDVILKLDVLHKELINMIFDKDKFREFLKDLKYCNKNNEYYLMKSRLEQMIIILECKKEEENKEIKIVELSKNTRYLLFNRCYKCDSKVFKWSNEMYQCPKCGIVFAEDVQEEMKEK